MGLKYSVNHVVNRGALFLSFIVSVGQELGSGLARQCGLYFS